MSFGWKGGRERREGGRRKDITTFIKNEPREVPKNERWKVLVCDICCKAEGGYASLLAFSVLLCHDMGFHFGLFLLLVLSLLLILCA